MTTTLERELYKAGVLTFDELAFMLPAEEDESEDQEAPKSGFTASVSFRGLHTGRVMVAATRSLLPVLAANMLGEDGEPPAQQQLDALAEVANVVCGNLLPAIAGPHEVFQFEAPIVFESSASPFGGAQEPTVETSITFDDGYATLLLFIDKDGRRGASIRGG